MYVCLLTSEIHRRANSHTLTSLKLNTRWATFWQSTNFTPILGRNHDFISRANNSLLSMFTRMISCLIFQSLYLNKDITAKLYG